MGRLSPDLHGVVRHTGPSAADAFAFVSTAAPEAVCGGAFDGATVTNVLPRGSGALMAVADHPGEGTAAAVLRAASAGAVRAMAACRGDSVHDEAVLIDGLAAALREAGAAADAAGGGPTDAGSRSLVAVRWPRAYVLHVGHSRVCHVRDGWLRQLTPDQTAYEDALDRGVMSDDQMRRWGLADHLRQTPLGAVGRPPEVHVGVMDLEPGDQLLVCTHGLAARATDEGMLAAVNRHARAEDAACDLAALAGAAGDARFALVVAKFPRP